MTRTKMLVLLALSTLVSMPVYSQQKAPQGGSVDAKLLPGAGNGSSGNVFSPNLFNGTANVSIPIYSYGNEGISLSYNTAGVKVDQLSGPIGVNWNLNAGGSIQRIVKDMPDEMNQDHNPTAVPGGGGGIWGGGADEYVWGVKGRLWHYFNGTTAVYNDVERYEDEESDDFIVSVGDLSFTFNIGLNGYIYTHPYQNVKIEMLINGVVVNGNPITPLPITVSTSGEFNDNNLSTLTFRIRDAQGNWYYFTKGDVSARYFGDDPESPVLGFNYTTRWVIQKIIKNDGLVTDYEYTHVSVDRDETGSYVAFSGMETSSLAPSISGTLVKVKHQMYSYARVASIKYPNCVTAFFIYTPDYYQRCDCQPLPTGYPHNKGDQILREIQISSGDNMMRYVFDQTYALSQKNSLPADKETPLGTCVTVDGSESYRYHRLRLKGIHMENEDGTKTEPYYKFGYDALRLPPRFSGAQDYFGYYNGNTVTANNGMLNIPSHTAKYAPTTTVYGVNKADNAAYAVAGLLDTVVNAYGGMTLFFYGGHSLSNVTSDAGITLPSDAYFMGASANDGVRVNSIKTIDPKYPSRFQQQSFTYSNGQRFMPGGYFDFQVNAGANNTLFNGNYISPHQFINGSNHGYSNITMVNSSDAGVLSRRDLVFKNISRGSGNTSYHKLGSTQYFEMPYTDKQYIKDWEIGLPLQTIEYDKDERILSHTINTYGTVEYMNSTLGKIENTKKLSVANGSSLDVIAQDVYRPYSGLSQLTQTEVRQYISNTSYTTDIVTYDYDDHNNLWQTTTQDSRGQFFRLDNIYNYHVSGPGVAYGNQTGTTLYNMTADGLELRVSMERWKLSNVNSPYNNELYDASVTGYHYQGGKIGTKKLHTLRSLAPVTYTSHTGMSMSSPLNNAFGKVLTAYNTNNTPADFQLTSEVIEYDAKGNPVETQMMGQAVYQSMIWDPSTGNKVAEVQHARKKDIAFTSFERSLCLNYTGSENSNDGGFTYRQEGVKYAPYTPVTGKTIYWLRTSAYPNYVITSPVLTSGTEYIVTFWCRDFAPTIDGAGYTNMDYYAIGSPVNGWQQFKAQFVANANTAITFKTSQDFYMDELRLFPVGATMNSCTYEPLFGISSSTDALGRITYYQYDVFGRNIVVKDQEGNVVSKKEYHVAQ